MTFVDTITANSVGIVVPEQGCATPFLSVAAAYWSEHCVECGAPACYSSCERFEPSNCGWCRRLENGIVPLRLKDGSIAWAVKFREWGKIELDTDGGVVSLATARRFAAIDNVLGGLVKRVTRLFWGARPTTTHTPISAYRRRRDILIRKLSIPVSYDTWSICCFAEREEKLMAAISYLDEGEVMVKPLELKPGMNKFLIPLNGIRSGAYFRIYSIEGTASQVVFTDLTVGVRKPEPVKYVKCVAWDLDNTLWKGILVEDGLENLELNDRAVSLIKELDRRGIIHTILSKNDAEPALAALKHFGLSDYFVFPQVNWNPKSVNLQHAAREINIGLDTFAFIDDSASERGDVGEHCPGVRVFDAAEIDRLASRPEFCPPVTAESSRRRISYLSEMSRRNSEAVFTGSHEEFLRACGISLVCERLIDERVRHRCWELVNRTNQLTLAARRYDESAFGALVDECDCFAVRCFDKYGDYGVVGFVAVAREGCVARVCEFVMSCRVAKKLCEQSVLLAIAQRQQGVGVEVIQAEVVKTGRNGALVEAFDVMPFARRVEDGRLVYSLDLSQVKIDELKAFRNPVTFV